VHRTMRLTLNRAVVKYWAPKESQEQIEGKKQGMSRSENVPVCGTRQSIGRK
jgi:hypothetical protein